MDPRRAKKAPPLPKFSSANDTINSKLQQKLSDFFSNLNEPAVAASEKPQVLESIKVEPPVVAQPTKKKIELASISSKLKDMLNSKQISLNNLKSLPTIVSHAHQPAVKPSHDYDPSHPNSYELCLPKRIEQLKQMALIEPYQDSDPIIHKENQSTDKTDKPNSHSTTEQLQAEQPEELEHREQLALKMMQKFGYKVGEGLGKQGQGIRTPLTIRKLTDTSCTIQPSSISLVDLVSPETSAKTALAACAVVPTDTVVLLNVSTPTEWNADIEQDLRCQLAACGLIEEWVAYSVNSDQLRIFVSFANTEQAFALFMKANGKYFGDRNISIRFIARSALLAGNYQLELHPHIAN